MDLSIIIPTYNRLWSLPETIQSCRNTKCSAEIIVIDDGSDDGTLEWLRGQDDVIVLQQAHLGKCWAVNKGFDIARGKYVRFLDSDDLINKFANDEQFELAELTSADVVVSGYQVINNSKDVIKTQSWIETNDFIAQQLGECDGSHYSAFLFNKSVLVDIPHRPDYAFRDDRMLILEVALKMPAIAVHPGYALLHRVHDNDRLQNSTGLKMAVQHFQHFNIYKHIVHSLQLQGGLNERRINAAINVLWPLARWTAKDHLHDAQKVIDLIVELKPGFKIPETGAAGKLYRALGFYKTEKLLNYARSVKGLFK